MKSGGSVIKICTKKQQTRSDVHSRLPIYNLLLVTGMRTAKVPQGSYSTYANGIEGIVCLVGAAAQCKGEYTRNSTASMP